VDEWRRAAQTDELLAEERVVTANDVGAFYKYVFKRATNHSGIGIVTDKNGLPILNGQDKANAFNAHFSSVGVADNNIIPACSDIALHSVLDSIVISDTDVLQSVNRLRSNASCGPDDLQPILFKRLRHCLTLPLVVIFNQLISVGAVPAEWLMAHIVPVFDCILLP